MSFMNRRRLMSLAVVAPVAGLIAPAPAYSWPHPNVGRIPGRGDALLAVGGGFCHAGIWFERGRLIDPGRVYTPAEWERVGPDVRAFLDRRHAAMARS